jgi:hypothetical protein
MFVRDKPFQHSHSFVIKGLWYKTNQNNILRLFSLRRLSFTIMFRLERLSREKDSCLLRTFANFGCKNVYNIWSRWQQGPWICFDNFIERKVLICSTATKDRQNMHNFGILRVLDILMWVLLNWQAFKFYLV